MLVYHVGDISTVEVRPPPTQKEIEEALIDLVINSISIIDKTTYIGYVNIGRYKLINGMAYIGNAVTEDFIPPVEEYKHEYE